MRLEANCWKLRGGFHCENMTLKYVKMFRIIKRMSMGDERAKIQENI